MGTVSKLCVSSLVNTGNSTKRLNNNYFHNNHY